MPLGAGGGAFPLFLQFQSFDLHFLRFHICGTARWTVPIGRSTAMLCPVLRFWLVCRGLLWLVGTFDLTARLAALLCGGLLFFLPGG